MWSNKLTQETYKIFAVRHYSNPVQSWTEFFQDFAKFTLLSKYIMTRNNPKSCKTNIATRTVLNTLIQLGNVFPGESLARLAFFICHKDSHQDVLTFLEFINRLPPEIPEINLSAMDRNEELLTELANL